jgi:hypothetical protein
MEDSPNVFDNDHPKMELIEKKGTQRYRDVMEAADEDDMERDEDANIDEDEESIEEDDMIIEDEEPNELEGEEMLLYERQISKYKLLQIVRSSNPKFEYQVRERLVDKG